MNSDRATGTGDFQRDGFTIAPGILSAAECADLAHRLPPAASAGTRGLLGTPEVQALAALERVLALVRPFLPGAPRAVRGIYFDKSPEANWVVSWHQDLTVAVHSRAEVTGFGPWSVKGGVPHVQPPPDFLAAMATVRIHLDAADEANGALRVMPGSHAHGRLGAPAIQEWVERGGEVLCAVAAGDALVMRPLLLHSSGKATAAERRHRRVIHLEFAGCDLPGNLEWAECAWRRAGVMTAK